LSRRWSSKERVEEPDEILARIAVDDEKTTFDTDALKELLIKAALKPDGDALARKVCATVWVGLTNLRAL
jgi:hypothetical protein